MLLSAEVIYKDSGRTLTLSKKSSVYNVSGCVQSFNSKRRRSSAEEWFACDFSEHICTVPGNKALTNRWPGKYFSAW